MSQVAQAATPTITYPLQNPPDLKRHGDIIFAKSESSEYSKVSDQNVWLQVTDIPFNAIAPTQPAASLVLALIRFRDTEAEIRDYLDRMPPIAQGTARIYDHLIVGPQKVPEGHTIFCSSGLDPRLREHLSAVTGFGFWNWHNNWNVGNKVYPVVDPYQTYVVRDQWDVQTQATAATKPMVIGTYTAEEFHFHRTMLQFFPKTRDRLIVIHLHEIATSFRGTTVHPSTHDDTDLRMSLARQILERNLIARHAITVRAQFVKVAILECLRQRIFLTTETWSDWLRTNVKSGRVDLKFDEARSATALLEYRQNFLRLETNMDQLGKTMEYVMSSLETDSEWQTNAGRKQDLLDMRHQCESGKAFAKYLRDINNEDLDHRQTAVEIKSAEDSARLTLLAAIFLPLSLSTSLLAMSTPLKDLNLLLYDFVGVAVILSGLAIVFYVIVLSVRKLSRSAKERQQNSPFGPRSLPLRALQANNKFFTRPGYFMGYIVVATSFLVGMLKDTTIGWKMLVYSIAGAAGLLILNPLVYVIRKMLWDPVAVVRGYWELLVIRHRISASASPPAP